MSSRAPLRREPPCGKSSVFNSGFRHSRSPGPWPIIASAAWRMCLLAFGIRDSGFGIQESGFGIRDSGFGIRDSSCGFRVSGFKFRRLHQLQCPCFFPKSIAGTSHAHTLQKWPICGTNNEKTVLLRSRLFQRPGFYLKSISSTSHAHFFQKWPICGTNDRKTVDLKI